jgi:hypothetical protein
MFTDRGGSQVKDHGPPPPPAGGAPSDEPSSFYVQRSTPLGRVGWTGPIRSRRRAEREAQAWRDAGWTAEVLANTPGVLRRVGEWQRLRELERTRPGLDTGIA